MLSLRLIVCGTLAYDAWGQARSAGEEVLRTVDRCERGFRASTERGQPDEIAAGI